MAKELVKIPFEKRQALLWRYHMFAFVANYEQSQYLSGEYLSRNQGVNQIWKQWAMWNVYDFNDRAHVQFPINQYHIVDFIHLYRV